MKKVLITVFMLCFGGMVVNAQQTFKPVPKLNSNRLHITSDLNKNGISNIQKRAVSSKIDPILLQPNYDSIRRIKGVQKASVYDSKKGVLDVSMKNGKRVFSVFIEADYGFNFQSLQGFQVRRISPDGNIAIGYLDEDAVQYVAKNPGVKFIQASKIRRKANKDGLTAIKADQVHLGVEGLSQGYEGQDIVVGVLDSGIDFDLADFSDENGTRIQFLLEFNYIEENGNEVPSQNVWTKEQIDSSPESVTALDGAGSGGHGTHVTATAVGNNGEFKGAAPKADIIFVKGDRSEDSSEGFADADIVDGVAFIFEKAEELGKPAVVNLSLGGNGGPLDGTSPSEQFLTQLTGQGKVIVAAAGNEGWNFLHAGTMMEANEVYMSLALPQDDISFDVVTWYDGGAISAYKVVAFTADDLTQVAETDWLTIGTSNDDSEEGIRLFDSNADEPAGFIYHNSEMTEYANNGDGVIAFYIYDGYEDADDEDFAFIDNYVWGIMFQASGNPGRFDATHFWAWAYPEELEVDGANFVVGDQDYSLGTPASSNNVISVGAFVSKNEWQTQDGTTLILEYPVSFFEETTVKPEVGELAYFSSRGPTRDGRLAPIVSAPGDIVFSARSRDIDDADLFADLMVENGDYIGYQGTSMASPFTSGVIALMLEANPDLDFDSIVDIFSEVSVQDEYTGDGANNRFGHGRLDALESVKMAQTYEVVSTDYSETPVTFELLQNYPNPFNPSTQIAFVLPSSGNVNIDVIDALGRKVNTLTQNQLFAAGRNAVQFNASTLSSGIYFYRLQVNLANGMNFSQVKQMTLVK